MRNLSTDEVVKLIEDKILGAELDELASGKTITTSQLLSIVEAEGSSASKATMQRAVSKLSKSGIMRPSGRKGLLITGIAEGARFDADANITRRPIGFVVNEIEDLFVGQVLRGLTEQAYKERRHVLIHNSRQSAESEVKALDELLRVCEGVILVPVQNGSYVDQVKLLMKKYNRRIVCLERTMQKDGEADPDFPLVSSDNRYGGELAAQMLMKSLLMTNGPQAKAKLFVIGRAQTTGQQERLEGFKERVKKYKDTKGADFEVVNEYWLRPTDCRYRHLNDKMKAVVDLDNPESAFCAALKEAINARKKGSIGAAIGVFCMADAIALCLYSMLSRPGEIEWLANERPRIPTDVAIVGFDDLFYAAPVGLSTIRQEFEELGRLAVSALLTGTATDRVRPTAQERATTDEVM